MTSTSPSHEDLAGILYQALAEPIGLELATSDPARARQRLYAARAKLGDPGLDRLQIRMSPFAEGNLVIVKGEAVGHQLPALSHQSQSQS